MARYESNLISRIVSFDHFSEGNIVLCFSDPNANPFSNISIGNDEDVSWANPSDAIALITKTVDFNINDISFIDGR